MKLHQLEVKDLVAEPRDVLGDTVPFFFYRYVTLFALADALGTRAKPALLEAGHKIGVQLMKHSRFMSLAEVAKYYRNNGLGVLTAEKGEGLVRFRIEECATCHGLPRAEMAFCYLDAGILTALSEALVGGTGVLGAAQEIECPGLGQSSCVFEMAVAQEAMRKLFPPNFDKR